MRFFTPNASGRLCCALWTSAFSSRRSFDTLKDTVHRWISAVYQCIRTVRDVSTMVSVGNFYHTLDKGSVYRSRTVCGILLGRNYNENYKRKSSKGIRGFYGFFVFGNKKYLLQKNLNKFLFFRIMR